MTAPTYEKLTPPAQGTRISVSAGGTWQIPDDPIVCLLRGDGIGLDVGSVPGITACAVKVLDAAVAQAYGGKRKIHWFDIHAGDAARSLYYPQVKDAEVNNLSEDEQRKLYMPDDSLKAFEYYSLGLKGPLTTPIGGGFRSINVYLRIKFDLYACVRPVRYFKGIDAPNKKADKVDMVIFRENTEDVYCGIDLKSGSDKAKRVIALLKELGYNVIPSSGIGIKPMSPEGSKRLMRMAIRYALEKKLPSVTIMHKGNIMKYTEGAFKDWGYEVAKEEFRDRVVTEKEIEDKVMDGKGRLLIKDRIADSMFQQIQLRPDEYSVIATSNLNGDYISDAAAAMTGGIGLAAGANIGDRAAMFEATHGTAPKYTGKNVANPGAVLLSGVMMLEHMHWDEAAKLVYQGVESTFAESDETARRGPGGKLHVTYDIARQLPNYTDKDAVSSMGFAERIIHHLQQKK